MTDQEYSQKDSMDEEIRPDKSVPFPANEDSNLPNRDHSEPSVASEFIIPKKGHEEKIEKILEQIQKLQHEMAESVRHEEQLVQLVNEQNRLFNTRFSQDEQKEKLIDKMHEELQKLKADLYKNLVRPVLLDVIHIRDNMRRMETDLNKKYPDGMVPIKTFSDFYLDLGDLLDVHNVEIFEEKTGTSFIPGKQKVVNRMATSNKDLTGIIIRSICSGYMYNGQVISPQRVDVYYFNESKTQTADLSDEKTQSN